MPVENYEFEPTNLDATELEKMKWVYENMGTVEVPKNPPTPGALSHLLWARDNLTEFYAQWKQACLAKPKEKDDTQEKRQRKKSTRDLRKRLMEIVG